MILSTPSAERMEVWSNFPGEPLRVYSLHLSFLIPEERMPQIDFLLSIPGRAGRSRTD